MTPTRAPAPTTAGRFGDDIADGLYRWFDALAEEHHLLIAVAALAGVPGPDGLDREQLLEAILARIDFCRQCGCTDATGCLEGCSWVGPDHELCSMCLPGARP